MVNVAIRFAGTLAERWLLPPTCIVCGDGTAQARHRALDLCHECADDFPHNLFACLRCGEPLPANSPRDIECGRCLKKPPRYDRAFCAFRYDYPVDHLIRALKFHGRLPYGRVLGELFAGTVARTRSTPWPEMMIPVPLAAARFRARGFNQAIEIGRTIERRLGIPLRADIAVRIRDTREQAGLDRKERRKNLRGAFAVAEKLAAKHIAILDDVITTGSTANELARTLRRAGATLIEVWAVARTGKR